jgi:hypothetical protein
VWKKVWFRDETRETAANDGLDMDVATLDRVCPIEANAHNYTHANPAHAHYRFN